jgi:hypothetical protein
VVVVRELVPDPHKESEEDYDLQDEEFDLCQQVAEFGQSVVAVGHPSIPSSETLGFARHRLNEYPAAQ